MSDPDASGRSGRKLAALVGRAPGAPPRYYGSFEILFGSRSEPILCVAPPRALPAALREELATRAEALSAEPGGQAGWGTVELDLDSGERLIAVAFASGAARGTETLEALGGIDLEAEGRRLAGGGSPAPPMLEGTALSLALSAVASSEPGAERATITALRLPWGSNVSVHPRCAEGDPLPPADQPEVLRITARGTDFAGALATLRTALTRTYVQVDGGATDKAALLGLLDRLEAGETPFDAAGLALALEDGALASEQGAEAALVAAAILTYEARVAEAVRRFFELAQRGRPEAFAVTDTRVALHRRGETYLCDVSKLAPRRFRVSVDGQSLEAGFAQGAAGRGTLSLAGRKHALAIQSRRDGHQVEVDGVPHLLTGDPGSTVRASMPGIVSALAVATGDSVTPGDPLVTLESMKLETVLAADRAGLVRRVMVRKYSQVGAGEPLLVLDPPVSPVASAKRGPRLSLAALAGSASPRASRPGEPALLDALRLVLGYDIDVGDLAAALASAPRESDPAREAVVLGAYLDVASLFRPLPTADFGDDWRRSVEEYLFTYLRDPAARGAGLPSPFLEKLRRALAHYGVAELTPGPALSEALFRLALAHRRQADHAAPMLTLLERWLERGPTGADGAREVELLDRLIAETRDREPTLHDLAREVRHRCFERPTLLASNARGYLDASRHYTYLATSTRPSERAASIDALVDFPLPLHEWLSERLLTAPAPARLAILEVMVRRYYRIREIPSVAAAEPGADLLLADYRHEDHPVRLIAGWALGEDVDAALGRLAALAARPGNAEREVVVDLYLWTPESDPPDRAAAWLGERLASATTPPWLARVAFALAGHDQVRHFTFRRDTNGAFAEETLVRGLHPMIAQRLQLWRLSNFRLERLDSPDEIHVLRGVARDNAADERLFVLGEVRDLTPVRDATGRVVELPQVEHLFLQAAAAVRRFQVRRLAEDRLHWNRIVLYLWPPLRLEPQEMRAIVARLAPQTSGLGLEKVVVHGRSADAASGGLADWILEISNPSAGAPIARFRKPSQQPLQPLGDYAQKVVDMRRRGLTYPYEILHLLAPEESTEAERPAGDFVEHDLDDAGALVPVERDPGENRANVVVGVVRNFTARYPEGMTRVVLLGDASRGMGALAEPECRRILGALDLADRLGVPLEWFALSAGARIAMDSGTENMDWIARVLRRLVELTQRGLEVNVIVDGIAVGAQPYWNAEATMLMHTRGILVMTPGASMVLTGKRALDFSGGVSAEDNLGIGGYQRIMGPNGQAQYFAGDLGEACRVLLAHYEHTYVAPGERFPRPAPTSDPRDRDVRESPASGGGFTSLDEVFSDATNPGRKRPFSIRSVMAAVADRDHPPLERWYGWRDAEIGVVWDAHVGGHSVAMLGFESQPLPRLGWVPAYGPDVWTAGTLFPQASRKIARAINAASGNRPLVVLANLSGFDGSPESMRNWQLEYGAEIGRAVVNFRGPIVFVVVSRYHGGAFVVFSATLHDNMQVAALSGTYASVIGGAPAAAVVFARDVEKRTRRDGRVAQLERGLADPRTADRAALRRRLDELLEEVRSEKLGEVAAEYDRVHDIARARRVGSVGEIIPPARLRPWVIEALERGIARERSGAPARTPDGGVA